jgi:hypothetical protein
MLGYRITPKRHAYNLEATEGGEVWSVLRTWPTEAEAVTHLKALQAAAAKAEPQPSPERPRGRPISRYRTTRYG